MRDYDSPKEMVLTGGPCSGKTTGLSYLQEKLMDRGVKAIIVPEAATPVITAAALNMADLGKDTEKVAEIQRIIFDLQRFMKTGFGRPLARAVGDEKCVILYDRAEVDGKAYEARKGDFDVILKERELALPDIRDGYDAA